MKKNKLSIQVLLLTIITSLAIPIKTFAADDNGGGIETIQFDFEGVNAARKELVIVQTLDNPVRVKEAVEFLKKYPCVESAEAMMMAMLNLVESLHETKRKLSTNEYKSVKSLKAGVESLIDGANKEIYKQVYAQMAPFLSEEEVLAFVENQQQLDRKIDLNPPLRTMRDIRQNPFKMNPISDAEKDLLIGANKQPQIKPVQKPLQLTEKKTEAEAAAATPAEPQLLVNIYAKKKADLRASLEKEIIGQPELIDALVDLDARNSIMTGKLTKSAALYLLGSAQSGKSNAVRAYVKAKHPKAKDPFKHLFEINTPVKDQASYWKITGTSSGLVGGNVVPPLLRFLVRHSGGRYRLIESQSGGGNAEFKVVEDPEWYPGFISPKDFQPETAVIHIKNFQDWAKEYKDQFVKTFLKDGFFELQQSAGGVFKIHVPVTIIISSDEGQLILSTRNANGEKRGYSYTQEQVLQRWDNAHKDDEQLKNAIRSSNQKTATTSVGESSGPGISEELLKLFTSKIVLLKPLNDGELEQLVQLKIDELNEKIKNSRSKLKLNLKPSASDLKSIAQYKIDYEASSASIAINVEHLLENTIFNFLTETQELYTANTPLPTGISLIDNPDGTKSLKLSISNIKGKKEIVLPIQSTQKDKYPTKLSPERIKYWQEVSLKIQKSVFGISKKQADRIANNFMLAEDRGLSTTPNEQKREGAMIMALLGLSSTGKSELTAVTSEAVLGHRAARFVIDFNQVKTIEDVKAKILGIRENGRCKPSDFIEMYTRSNGNLLVVFEEMANAPRELLKAAYDILREPIVTTFCDGVPRSMKQVKVIITGNAGEEIYKGIPSHIQEELRAMMWQQFYQYFINNPLAQRNLLEQFFSPALINRIGENINFMAPLSFQSRWELIQSKIISNIKNLVPDNGRLGWKVKFDTHQDLVNFMEMADQEGFILEEQGASIDRFINRIFDHELRVLLMTSMTSQSKMGDSSTILLKFDKNSQTESTHEGEQKKYTLKVLSEDKTQSLDLPIEGRRRHRIPTESSIEVLRTAIHEVGHLVAELYSGHNLETPTHITILPGVTYLDGKMSMYLGLATSEAIMKASPTRENIVSSLSSFLGGYVAEQTFFGSHSKGVSSDFERAAQIAQDVILRTGFSKEWGVQAIPQDMSKQDYINSLSDSDKAKLKAAVDALLKEAEQLAQSTINRAIANGTFQKFTAVLARKGDLLKQEIEEIASSAQEKKSILPSWLMKWKSASAKSVLEELKKGEIVTVQSLIDKEVSTQRQKALKLDVPVASPSQSCDQILAEK